MPLESWAKASLASPKETKKAAPLGLKDCVRQALKANRTLLASKSQAKASEEARKSARGAFGPKLGLTYSAYKQVRKSEPVTTHTPELGNYAFGIEISQPVFQGFRLLADYQKAALNAQSDQLAVRKARLELIVKVQSAFISYLLAKSDVENQAEARARVNDQLLITRALYAEGLAPKLDVLQAEVDLSEAEQTLLQAEKEVELKQAELNVLLALPAHKAMVYQGSLAYISFGLSLEHCLARAYKFRPDLEMARLAVEIAGKDRQSVRSAYYPKIEAYYNVTNAGNTPLLRQGGEYGSRYSSWEVGAKATWDVFQWGTTYYADQQAGALVTKVKHEAEQLRLEVGSEIKTRFLNLREAEKRIQVAKVGIRSASEAYVNAQARYREQVGTGFDVLNTSSKLTTARYALATAYAD
ncbi:MAG: TolC family protein, partial [Desulfovibrio sp.]|nr:TolC family protein [Desulfovibrio sp.]